MKTLEDFIAKNKAKGQRSKLYPFANEILSLYKGNYSTNQIKSFLFECKNVKVSQRYICTFIKQHTSTNTKSTQKVEKKEVIEQKTQKNMSNELNEYLKDIKKIQKGEI